MDILGGVVLIDAVTDAPYSASHDATIMPDSWGVGILGGVVLIDPATDGPYKFGDN